MNLIMTYPSLFMGAVSFNGVLDADPCYRQGYCHTYCGLDSSLCEIKWTTPQVAQLPYVTLMSGAIADSHGSYDPVAYGVAVHLIYHGMASCDSYRIVSNDNGKLSISDFDDVDNVDEANAMFAVGGFFDIDETSMMGIFDQDMSSLKVLQKVAWMGSDNYFLDPIYYTMALEAFIPTFNPSTGKVTKIGSSVYPLLAFIANQPASRAAASGTLASKRVIIFLSCDVGDPFGLHGQADKMFHWVVNSGESRSASEGFGLLFDNDYDGGCGHCMNLRDWFVAYVFFCDVFHTWSACGKGEGVEDYMCFDKQILGGHKRSISSLSTINFVESARYLSAFVLGSQIPLFKGIVSIPERGRVTKGINAFFTNDVTDGFEPVGGVAPVMAFDKDTKCPPTFPPDLCDLMNPEPSGWE